MILFVSEDIELSAEDEINRDQQLPPLLTAMGLGTKADYPLDACKYNRISEF